MEDVEIQVYIAGPNQTLLLEVVAGLPRVPCVGEAIKILGENPTSRIKVVSVDFRLNDLPAIGLAHCDYSDSELAFTTSLKCLQQQGFQVMSEIKR